MRHLPPIDDLEPGDNNVVLPVQFTAEGARLVTGDGIDVPRTSRPLKLQLVLQPTGHYGLRFIEAER